jgi:hypothetical protein
MNWKNEKKGIEIFITKCVGNVYLQWLCVTIPNLTVTSKLALSLRGSFCEVTQFIIPLIS